MSSKKINWSIFRQDAFLSRAPKSRQIAPNWRYLLSERPFWVETEYTNHREINLKTFFNHPASLRMSFNVTTSTESFRFPIWAFFSFFSRFTRHEALESYPNSNIKYHRMTIPQSMISTNPKIRMPPWELHNRHSKLPGFSKCFFYWTYFLACRIAMEWIIFSETIFQILLLKYILTSLSTPFLRWFALIKLWSFGMTLPVLMVFKWSAQGTIKSDSD